MKHHNKKSESCAIKLEVNKNNQDRPKSNQDQPKSNQEFNQDFNQDIEKVREKNKITRGEKNRSAG